MGSVCMAERKSRRCRMKVKPKRAGRHPCQRQTGVFFRTGLQQKCACMERHMPSAAIRNKSSTRQPSLEVSGKAVGPERQTTDPTC